MKDLTGGDSLASKASFLVVYTVYHGGEELEKTRLSGRSANRKATTPFLLARVKDLTGGDSLASNIQLVFNNARLAAQTAVELAK